MQIELMHRTDGNVEIRVEGAGYSVPRVFSWLSDAYSIMFANYAAKHNYTYTADWDTGYSSVEIWTSTQGETLPMIEDYPNKY